MPMRNRYGKDPYCTKKCGNCPLAGEDKRTKSPTRGRFVDCRDKLVRE